MKRRVYLFKAGLSKGGFWHKENKIIFKYNAMRIMLLRT
jgi:hypothetical protein